MTSASMILRSVFERNWLRSSRAVSALASMFLVPPVTNPATSTLRYAVMSSLARIGVSTVTS